MKQFACGDVVPGCGVRFTGPTTEDILDQVAGHAAADHGLTEVSAEVADAVRAATVDA